MIYVCWCAQKSTDKTYIANFRTVFVYQQISNADLLLLLVFMFSHLVCNANLLLKKLKSALLICWWYVFTDMLKNKKNDKIYNANFRIVFVCQQTSNVDFLLLLLWLVFKFSPMVCIAKLLMTYVCWYAHKTKNQQTGKTYIANLLNSQHLYQTHTKRNETKQNEMKRNEPISRMGSLPKPQLQHGCGHLHVFLWPEASSAAESLARP